MDVEKLDASYERAVAFVRNAKERFIRVKDRIAVILFFPIVIGFILLIIWIIWECITSPAVRHQVGQAELRQLKWYLIFGAVGWVISKIWKKKPETDDGEEPSVHGGEQKAHRRKRKGTQHDRVQRGN